MVLFVKRTFAIKVSGTSRIDQSNEGGGGTWKKICPSSVPAKAGPVWFSEGRVIYEHPQRPFPPPPPAPPHCEPRLAQFSELRTVSKLIQAARPVGITVSDSLGWEPWPEEVTLHSTPFPSIRTPPLAGLRPGRQSKWNEITLLLVSFRPFHG